MEMSPDRVGLIDTLARLVAANTENPPGREIEAARYLADRLAGLGLAVDMRATADGVRMWWRGSTMGRGRCSRSIRIWTWCRQAAAGPPILSSSGARTAACSAAVRAMPKERLRE